MDGAHFRDQRRSDGYVVVTALGRRLAVLERQRKPSAEFEHVRCDGWAIIARAGKAVVAIPDNGRDHHA